MGGGDRNDLPQPPPPTRVPERYLVSTHLAPEASCALVPIFASEAVPVSHDNNEDDAVPTGAAAAGDARQFGNDVRQTLSTVHALLKKTSVHHLRPRGKYPSAPPSGALTGLAADLCALDKTLFDCEILDLPARHRAGATAAKRDDRARQGNGVPAASPCKSVSQILHKTASPLRRTRARHSDASKSAWMEQVHVAPVDLGDRLARVASGDEVSHETLTWLSHALHAPHSGATIRALPAETITSALSRVKGLVRGEGSGDVCTCEEEAEEMIADIGTCFASAKVALGLMGLRGLPKQAYQEDLVEDAIAVFVHHLRHHVLAQLDAEYRQRVQSGKGKGKGEEGKGKGEGGAQPARKKIKQEIPKDMKLKVKGKGMGKGRDREWTFIGDEHVDAIAGHLASLMPLFAGVMRHVRIPEASALALSKHAIEAFAVPKLHLLQHASLGLISAVFAAYPLFQDILLNCMHVQIFRRVPLGGGGGSGGCRCP